MRIALPPCLRYALVAAPLLLVLAGAADAQPRFFPPIVVPIGFAPNTVALGDVDEDGHLDLVVASDLAAQVSVLPGHGDGTFGAALPLALPDSTRTLLLTDWNGDGHLDLLVGPAGAAVVRSYLGQGNGTFVPGPTAALPASARRLVAADLDGDGIADLAGVTAASSVTTFVVKGAGGGAFGPRTDLETISGMSALDVAIGPLDGDALPDLVVPLFCDQCAGRAYRNLGGMTFSASPVAGFARAQSALLTDVTHDGVADLLVASAAPNPNTDVGGLYVHTGNGQADFNASQIALTARGAGPMMLGPWGGATESDCVVANRVAQSVSFVRVTCDGVAHLSTSASVSGQPVALALGDVDEDGVVDVATADHSSGNVTILPVVPNASYYDCTPAAQVPTTSLDFGNQPRFVTTALSVSVHNSGATNLLVAGATFAGSQEFRINSSLPVLIAPGASSFLSVVFDRLTEGAQTATMTLLANDGTHPSVALTGFSRHVRPVLQLNTTSVDFQTQAVGFVETRPVSISNVGTAVLVVSGASATGDFSVVPPVPTSVAAGASASFTIRYPRTALGAANGEFHLLSNDSLAPDAVVPLSGYAGEPGIAQASDPGSVTLGVGSDATRTIVLRNVGPSPLHVTLPAGGTSLAEVSPFDVGSSPLPVVRGDTSGTTWDVQANGSIGGGTGGEYAGGMQRLPFPAVPSAALGLGGREIRLGPVSVAPGVLVTRKCWVPESGESARFVEVAENPNDIPATYSFDLLDQLSYTTFGQVRTSSGDGTFSVLDDWIVLPPDATPGRRAIGRVVVATPAAHRPTTAFVNPNAAAGAYSRSRYDVTIPPRGRIAVVEWAVQGIDANDARARAAALAADPAALDLLDAIDRAALWNGPQGPLVFQVTGGPLTIAPGDSATIPVRFDAGAATHEADVTGELRMPSDQSGHAPVVVPLTLHITGGAVVGVDPPAPSGRGGPAFALAGLVPNPARARGGARIAYRLATSEPAEIVLYDVRGRVVGRRVLEHPGPGLGSLELAQLAAGRIAPQIVWIRLAQGGRVATRKGIVLP